MALVLAGVVTMSGSQLKVIVPPTDSSAWTMPDTLTVKPAFDTTPLCPQITCRFAGDACTSRTG